MEERDKRCLVLEHLEYGRKIAAGKLRSWGIFMPEDELRSLVGLALCEAAARFDAAVGAKFETFAYYHLVGVLTEYVRQTIKHQTVQEEIGIQLGQEEAPPGMCAAISENPEQRCMELEAQLKLVQAGRALKPIEREVLRRYFIEDLPVRRIAAELNCCHSHVSRVKTRAVQLIRKSFSTRVCDRLTR